MTRSFVTVRVGATVTRVHCKDTAAMWVNHLIAATFNQQHDDVQGLITRHAPGDSELHDSSKPSPSRGTTGLDGNNMPRSCDCPGGNVGLNVKGLDVYNTPRSGDVTGCKTDTTLRHMSTPRTYTGSTSTTSLSPGSMHRRLATIATTLQIQDATGTSHLQQLEMHPEAHGVANTVRPQVKNLRRQRNRALHGTPPTAETLSAKTTGNISATSPASELASTTENNFSVTTKGNTSATSPASKLASTTENAFPVTTKGNTSATNPASELGSTTENTFSDTTKGNNKAANSRRLPDRHQHSGNKFDAMVDAKAAKPRRIPLHDFAAMADAKLANIRSYDPGFQCPDLTPRRLVVHLAGIEMEHRFGYDSDGTS